MALNPPAATTRSNDVPKRRATDLAGSAHRNRRVTIVIPAKNEAESLRQFLPELLAACPSHDILVVNDGSTDDTEEICARHEVRTLTLPYSVGNGGAIKAGARATDTDIVVFMDGDGQHNPSDIPKLLECLDDGYDMAVGARSWSSQSSTGRGLANALYNRLAGWMVNQKVPDLTSGYRAVRKTKLNEFLYLLPNGFSYPTTITMAFFRAGYGVAFVPITARSRSGKSHISILRDGLRFILIIFRVGTLYSPFKLFFPISAAFTALGLGHYAYTFYMAHRFTNMSALLLIAGMLVFLLGLVSEQITNLLYSRTQP